MTHTHTHIYIYLGFSRLILFFVLLCFFLTRLILSYVLLVFYTYRLQHMNANINLNSDTIFNSTIQKIEKKAQKKKKIKVKEKLTTEIYYSYSLYNINYIQLLI